ncbi:hypothetical protein cypCar_00021719 [Cyprinus carpio]|nr:hypothetical protein cypCar_00021719 [Cyprinus carpio]
MEQEYFQTLESSADLCRGLPGLLRYKRESQERMYSPQHQQQLDSPICCQFCGSRAWPPLDLVYAETREDFCCEEYRELFEIVVHEKHLAMKRSDARPSGPARLDDPFITEDEELQDKAQERGKRSYPSGNLALIILSSKKQRICIIHDDMPTPLCPVRALFQSNGRATCYHSNGSIW